MIIYNYYSHNTKNFSLSVHNYFDNPTKLFSDLFSDLQYVAKFLDTSTKSFFLSTH